MLRLGRAGRRSHCAANRFLTLNAPDEAVKGEEIAEAHERLAALHGVGHRLGLQRMHGPEQRHGKGEKGGIRRQGPRQRAPHDAKQRQSGQEVNGQIHRVIAPHVRAAERVIDRER